MGLRIATNLAAEKVQSNLRKISDRTDRALESLSSGKRITKAGDDSAGLAIATTMSAQVGGLKQALRNSNDAIDTNTNASSVSSSSAKRPSPSISSPGRGKKMKDSKDACVKVSDGESQEVLVKTAAKMTLEDQISKSKSY